MNKTKIPKFRPKKPSHLSHHPEPDYAIRGRIWLEKDGELYMGWGRAMLLEQIGRLGSIAAAAHSSGAASYTSIAIFGRFGISPSKV